MSESVAEILSKENCLNCSSNCAGFCSAIHKRLDPEKISQGIMECEEQGDKQFKRILSDFQLEWVAHIEG